jgi:hypothetical protein
MEEITLDTVCETCRILTVGKKNVRRQTIVKINRIDGNHPDNTISISIGGIGTINVTRKDIRIVCPPSRQTQPLS